MVWFLLRNVENIASSVGSIAQYRFSLSRKAVQWTSSRVNNYGYESKRRREKIYFRVYRSISFFTGFVECQEQGLQQQNLKNRTIRSASQLQKRIEADKRFWKKKSDTGADDVYWRNEVSHRWGGTVYVAKYYSGRGRRRTGIWRGGQWWRYFSNQCN